MESSFQPFRDFINEMGMGEVVFCGRRWTWANNRHGEGFIEERLDMFFGSVEWLLEFDKSVAKHILSQSSDHSMVLLDSDTQQQKWKPRFTFDSRWSRVQSCVNVIKESWNVNVAGSRMFILHKKVRNCRT